MATKKRIATTIGAMVLTAVLAVGGTLAYLSTITETKINTFSSSSNVDGWIEETEWSEKYPNGWTDYRPGETEAKDPTVVIEKGSESVWVGMQLTFKDAVGDVVPYSIFKGYASHDGINEEWKLIAKNAQGEELYAYKAELVPTKDANAASTTIFDNITVNAGVTTVGSSTTDTYFKRVIEYNSDGSVDNDKMTPVSDTTVKTIAYYDQNGNAVGTDTLPTFTIDVKGYAVQAVEVTYDDAVTEMIALANVGVNPNSPAYFAAV